MIVDDIVEDQISRSAETTKEKEIHKMITQKVQINHQTYINMINDPSNDLLIVSKVFPNGEINYTDDVSWDLSLAIYFISIPILVVPSSSNSCYYSELPVLHSTVMLPSIVEIK